MIDGYSHYSNDVPRGEKPILIERSAETRGDVGGILRETDTGGAERLVRRRPGRLSEAARGETAEAAEIEKEVVETEKETTEAVEKETADAVETEKETTEAETKDAEVTETETEAAAETSETEETAEDASKEETAAGSKENEETEAAKETVTETSKAAETTAEAKEQENKKAEAATDSDLVGIGYCSTAKAYTTTVKALKALDDIQGLKVTYAINPEYSARIVDGPRGVEEGDALVFGVKNQIGYAIESVTANGEFLEADSTSDNEDGISESNDDDFQKLVDSILNSTEDDDHAVNSNDGMPVMPLTVYKMLMSAKQMRTVLTGIVTGVRMTSKGMAVEVTTQVQNHPLQVFIPTTKMGFDNNVKELINQRVRKKCQKVRSVKTIEKVLNREYFGCHP